MCAGSSLVASSGSPREDSSSHPLATSLLPSPSGLAGADSTVPLAWPFCGGPDFSLDNASRLRISGV